MVLQISPGPVPQEYSAGELATTKEIENKFLVSRAVNIIRRDFDCTAQDAVALICRDWMELRGLEVLSPNPLEHSTPADFKPPTWLDRFKQLF